MSHQIDQLAYRIALSLRRLRFFKKINYEIMIKRERRILNKAMRKFDELMTTIEQSIEDDQS